ncbi:MAG: hypothetical protein A3E98_00325 [Candidatus Doudnabacteria bacterium RIFCSPHIGHO2_12_FULL_48_11]|uniref:Transcriptional repressor PaaX-like central Cas2-like domain-containing protein n=1 Tax=Candidatus Doudnabacteria bacterium RIFCSPHIGHO2_01_FULL_46_24 TaxID=1817825 RepID=A0A1F5NUZ2_9BACT|nr:MAG: hypothetical protein A2720_03005 [Candidatus Doudnabacteria bacterium RIFCSPHIGHO2_01_FULL_46_24]OGE95787.1 MAG: hypothetical protein A3E98_00325 [Candidatus Doudnabacteria bacterium RIFCSPHIGHO2_12_FULL_48_11]
MRIPLRNSPRSPNSTLRRFFLPGKRRQYRSNTFYISNPYSLTQLNLNIIYTFRPIGNFVYNIIGTNYRINIINDYYPMKAKTKKKIMQAAKSIALDILQIISELPELIPDPFETPYHYKKRLHYLAGGYSYDQINRSLYHLENKQLIKKQKSRKSFRYILSITGKQKLLMSQISRMKFVSRDGNSCIIVFDIPEEKHKHRKFLRRFLIQNGFMNLQRSVMIGPKFLSKEFYELLEELQLRQNVTVIKGQIFYY